MKNFINWLKEKTYIFYVLLTIVAVVLSLSIKPVPKPNEALKEYKDGIQNHLTWDIKGQCFFVRPNDDVTVYLIRVQDCDKK